MKPHLHIALLLSQMLWAGAAVGAAAKGGEAAASYGSAGAVELGLSGLQNLTPSEGNTVYLDMRLGYYLAQHLEVGLTTLIGTTAEGRRDTYGIFVEYGWQLGDKFVPFVGTGLKHAAPPRGETKDGKILDLSGGVALLVATNAALVLSLQMEFADEKVLGPAGHRKKRDDNVVLGWRLVF